MDIGFSPGATIAGCQQARCKASSARLARATWQPCWLLAAGSRLAGEWHVLPCLRLGVAGTSLLVAAAAGLSALRVQGAWLQQAREDFTPQ